MRPKPEFWSKCIEIDLSASQVKKLMMFRKLTHKVGKIFSLWVEGKIEAPKTVVV